MLKQGMATAKDTGKKRGDADDESSDSEGEDGGGVGSGGRRRWGRRRKYKPGEYGPEHEVATQRIQRWLRRRWTMERFKVCSPPATDYCTSYYVLASSRYAARLPPPSRSYLAP